MNPPAVVDTNVVVIAFLSGQANSPPSRILDGMLCGEFVFWLSLDLLQEYRTVLLRPKIKKLHGLTEQEIDQILTIITTKRHDTRTATCANKEGESWRSTYLESCGTFGRYRTDHRGFALEAITPPTPYRLVTARIC